MRKEMREVYIAWDGKEFSNEQACKQYEMVNKEPEKEKPYVVEVSLRAHAIMSIEALNASEAQDIAIEDVLGDPDVMNDIEWEIDTIYVYEDE